MNKIRSVILMFFLLISGWLTAQQRDLNFFLEKAKINSPLINKSKNDNKIADFNLEEIKKSFTSPEINLEANVLFAPVISHERNSSRFEWVSKGADSYYGYDQAATDGGQYQAIVSLKQPLFTKPSIEALSDKISNTKLVNDNTIALTIHEIEQLVSHQYILCLLSKLEIESNEAIRKGMAEQLKLMEKLVENAIYKQTDLLLLQIEYQNIELKTRQLTDEYKSKLYDLNLLSGITDTTTVDLKEINLEIKADTLYSPFLARYIIDSLGIINDQLIENLKYKPQLFWFANTGLNAIYLPDFNRFGASVGLGFSWNIYDGNQRKIKSKSFAIEQQSLMIEKQNFMRQNIINKNKILDQLKAVDLRMITIANQLDTYKNLLMAYKEELYMGEVSVMDYKNLIKDVQSKKLEHLQMKMEKQLLISLYNYWNY